MIFIRLNQRCVCMCCFIFIFSASVFFWQNETNRKVVRELSVLLGAKKFYFEFSRTLLRLTGQRCIGSASSFNRNPPASPSIPSTHDTQLQESQAATRSQVESSARSLSPSSSQASFLAATAHRRSSDHHRQFTAPGDDDKSAVKGSQKRLSSERRNDQNEPESVFQYFLFQFNI